MMIVHRTGATKLTGLLILERGNLRVRRVASREGVVSVIVRQLVAKPVNMTVEPPFGRTVTTLT
jgi:hypothetical protein